MTNEERHIAVLDRMLESMDVYDSIQPTTERKKAIKAAIKALEQQPCDAISREDIQNYIAKYLSQYLYEDVRQAVEVIDAYIGDMPSVTQKSGVWVEIDDEPHEVWECDHCGFVIDGSGCIEPYEYRDTYKFCPNCGAKMVEPQESEVRNEE